MSRRERVHNESTQEARRKVLRDTMHGRAIAEANTIGGRWAAESKTRVIGSAPVEYATPARSRRMWV